MWPHIWLILNGNSSMTKVFENQNKEDVSISQKFQLPTADFFLTTQRGFRALLEPPGGDALRASQIGLRIAPIVSEDESHRLIGQHVSHSNVRPTHRDGFLWLRTHVSCFFFALLLCPHKKHLVNLVDCPCSRDHSGDFVCLETHVSIRSHE